MLSNKKKWIKPTIYVVCLVLFFYLIFITDFVEILTHLKEISIELIALLIFFQCLTQVLLMIQWARITKSIHQNAYEIKNFYKKIFYILSAGSVVEALTPGAKIGGEVTRLYYLKNVFKLDTKKAGNIIVVQKSISMSVLFSICIFSMSYVFFTVSLGLNIVWKCLLLGISMISLIVLLSLLFGTKAMIRVMETKKSKRMKKLCVLLVSYEESLGMITKKEWIFEFIISLIVWLLFPIKMLILIYSFGINKPIILVFAITMTAYMIGTLPISPGGLGAFEGTMVSLLSMIGITAYTGLTITLIFRFVTFWFVMLVSGGYALVYQFIQKRRSYYE